MADDSSGMTLLADGALKREEGTPTLTEEKAPIDFLAPDSKQHEYVLDYLLARLRFSENKMKKFYPRWRQNELMLQAYVSAKDWEAMDSAFRTGKEIPGIEDSPVAINVPFAWATVNSIVTYLLHMFAGRSPIFQVSSYRAEQVRRAKNMEMFLQYNADVVKFVRTLYFFLMDGETYGVAALRTLWKRELKQRPVMVPPDPNVQAIAASVGRQAQPQKKMQDYVAFEGSSAANIDPFMFFPDPRVPMHECNVKGEFVFWRAFMGKHELLKAQASGQLKYVDKVDPNSGRDRNDSGDDNSRRAVRALGDSGDSSNVGRDAQLPGNYQVDQGTIEIIPNDLGLGTSKVPEKWMFTILNKTQIVQAEKIDLPSGKHPVEVAEPNSVGYAFGQLGTVDMLGPMQQVMSWFMNSHIFNVRASLNNMLVVDPTKVEMQDLKSPKPGKLIRLKNTAFGLSDPKNAIQQLTVSDMTRGHISDFQMFGRLAADLTGASDNNRGLQDAGGRKTATEIRTAADAGTSRLAAKGKVYSAMAFTGLAETWALNAQTNLSEQFELSVLGAQEPGSTVRLDNAAIQGDFVFPVNDGTLPVDKLAMLEVWKEIYTAVIADPQIRAQYDIIEMFDWMAQLGGAQNIKQFRLNMVPQQQQMQQMQSGQGMPMGELVRAFAGQPGMMGG